MLRKSEKFKPMCVARSNQKQDEFLNVDIPEIDIPKRIEKYNLVMDALERIDVKQFQFCISGKNEIVSKYFENPIVLGTGSFGIVRKITLKSNPKIDIVVKEAWVENVDIMSVVNLKPRWQTNRNQPIILNEAKIGLLVNNIIFGNQFPGFLLTYNVSFCSSCSVVKCDKDFNDEPFPLCSNIFMEQASSSLNKYIQTLKNTTVEIVSEKTTSILHQLLIGLHILQWRFQIHHGDIHDENIFLFNVPHDGGYFKYVIDDDIYYVKNIGVLACLGDFGRSKSFHPSYCNSKGYLGQRNVEIVDEKMIPLIDFDDDSNQTIAWDFDGSVQRGTFNDIFIDGSYNFGQVTDWTDSLRFPPEEFKIDTILVFMSILEIFEELKIFPPNFTRTCEILSSDDDESLLRDLNQGSILLRADLMLKHLYKPPQLDKIPVIREYCVR